VPVTIDTIVMSVLVAQSTPELDDPLPLKAFGLKITPRLAYWVLSVTPGTKSSKLMVKPLASVASSKATLSSAAWTMRVICIPFIGGLIIF
jgi:hypothetical protein